MCLKFNKYNNYPSQKFLKKKINNKRKFKRKFIKLINKSHHKKKWKLHKYKKLRKKIHKISKKLKPKKKRLNLQRHLQIFFKLPSKSLLKKSMK